MSPPWTIFMVETTKYDVIRKLIKAEIRRYPSIIIAKVDGQGDEGFNSLFAFITGHNTQKARVEMTAPVISERIEMTAPVLSDNDSLAFVMPDGYELETTPEPLDKHIKVIKIPERYVAVLRFSGRWTKSIFKTKSKELLDELAKMNVKPRGNFFLMRYNPPFTPWFMRRNEVAAEVDLA